MVLEYLMNNIRDKSDALLKIYDAKADKLGRFLQVTFIEAIFDCSEGESASMTLNTTLCRRIMVSQ